MEQMYKICDRLIWIEQGLIRDEGIPKFIGEQYLAEMEGRRLDRVEEERNEKENEMRQESANEGETQKKKLEEELPAFCQKRAHRIGNRKVKLIDAYILNAAGEKTKEIGIGEKFEVVYCYSSEVIDEKLNFVISFTRDDGTYCFGTGSISGGSEKNAFLSEKTGTVKVSFEKNNLQSGRFLLDVGIQGLDGTVFDYIYSALEMTIEKQNIQVGIANMSRRWSGRDKVIHQEY